MKVLITGANGQLGYHLKQVFADQELFLGDTTNFDITNADLVMQVVEQFKPDVIVHAAAYVNVDKAEVDKELCFKVNVDGSKNVAKAAQRVRAKMLAISTDYVFSGDAKAPYAESAEPSPLSYYGQTKYEGEKMVMANCSNYFICRTSWLYGGRKPTPEMDFAQPGLPKNFVLTMLRVGKDKEVMEIVGDQLGGPTYAQDVAETVSKLAKTEAYGVYHLTNTGVTSWATFATEIFSLVGYKTAVKPITSDVWLRMNPQATKRPAYSVLGHKKIIELGIGDLRPWQEALKDYLSEYIKINRS